MLCSIVLCSHMRGGSFNVVYTLDITIFFHCRVDPVATACIVENSLRLRVSLRRGMLAKRERSLPMPSE